MTVKNNALTDCANNQEGGSMDSAIQPTIPVYPVNLEQATIGNDGGKMPEHSRFSQGRDLESRVYSWLSSSPYITAVAHSGVETVFPESFCQVLRRVRTDTIVSFCAIPDFVCIRDNDQMLYVEVKSSQTIEKGAWESYSDLDQRIPVFLILEVKGKAYIQRISLIEFQDSLDYTRHYIDPFTVSSEGWIVTGRNAQRSGRPYRAIDLCSMINIDLEAS